MLPIPPPSPAHARCVRGAGEQGSLTEVGACDSLKIMDQPDDSSSFPVRRQVGRPSTPRQVLWQLEEMHRFVQKHTQGKQVINEGDLFPVRKVVGRTPPKQGWLLCHRPGRT